MNKLAALENYLQPLGPLAVAVSGGVDSMTLAVVTHRVNKQTQIFHALSPAVPSQATGRVKAYAAKEKWNLNLIDAGEIRSTDYLANPVNRCYFCKTHLYDAVTSHTRLPVLSGTNMDDLGDYRPGLIAATEHQVIHPYVEVGISKDDLRDIARSLGLTDLQDLPAAPCLSSRVTTGIPIDPNLLPLINETEESLWSLLQEHLPLKGVRCRVRPTGLAIELETDHAIDQNADWVSPSRQRISAIFNARGYGAMAQSVTFEAYRRGSAFLINTRQVD